MATRTPPEWRFVNDRQHWTIRDASDQGFPMNGEWRINFGGNKPRLQSGVQSWRAEAARSMEMEAAYKGKATTARIFWKRLDDDKFDTKKSMALELNPDGKFHTYRIDLGRSPEYRGLIIGLTMDPVSEARPGEQLAVKRISFVAPKEVLP
jgi:hypothetical protein